MSWSSVGEYLIWWPTNQPTKQAGQAKPQEADNLKRGLPRSSFFSASKNCTITKMCSVQCCSSVQRKRGIIEKSKKVQSAKTEKSKKGVEMKLLSDLATHFTVLTLAFTIISRKILVTDFSRKKKKMTRKNKSWIWSQKCKNWVEGALSYLCCKSNVKIEKWKKIMLNHWLLCDDMRACYNVVSQ